MTIFRFLKIAAARHLIGFSEFAILNVLWRKECQCAAPCQIWSKSVKRLRRYRDFTVFKLMAAAILDFDKFNFLTADTLGRRSLRILPNFVKIDQFSAEIWRFFDYSRWRLSAMLNFEKCDFMVQYSPEYHGLHHVKFGRNRSNFCEAMAT